MAGMAYAAGAVAPVVSIAKSPAFTISDKAMVHTVLGSDTKNGPAGVAFDVLKAFEGWTMDSHAHEQSDELLYFLGRGLLTVGKSMVHVHHGDAILIKAGSAHSFVGESNLLAFQFYQSAGPEQRFLAMKKAKDKYEEPAPLQPLPQDPRLLSRYDFSATTADGGQVEAALALYAKDAGAKKKYENYAAGFENVLKGFFQQRKTAELMGPAETFRFELKKKVEAMGTGFPCAGVDVESFSVTAAAEIANPGFVRVNVKMAKSYPVAHGFLQPLLDTKSGNLRLWYGKSGDDVSELFAGREEVVAIVRSGSLELSAGGKKVKATAGDVIHALADSVQNPMATGKAPVRLLVFSRPAQAFVPPPSGAVVGIPEL